MAKQSRLQAAVYFGTEQHPTGLLSSSQLGGSSRRSQAGQLAGVGQPGTMMKQHNLVVFRSLDSLDYLSYVCESEKDKQAAKVVCLNV